MITLQGSENQIKWAEQIRKEISDKADKFIELVKEEVEASEIPMSEQAKKYTVNLASGVYNLLLNQQKAENYIHYRTLKGFISDLLYFERQNNNEEYKTHNLDGNVKIAINSAASRV